MVLKYQISPYPVLLENMIVRVWEAQSDGPLGWVYEQILPQPHNVPVTITINGLDKVVHIVRLYSAGGVLLHQYNVEPTTDLVTIFNPIQFKIGDGGANTPDASVENVSVSDTYANPILIGLLPTEYTVFRNGVGVLHPGVHYTSNADGFTLAGGDGFNDLEEFTILRRPAVVTGVVNDSVVGKWVKGVTDISANTSYIPAHLRTLIRLSGSPEYTFPVGAAIPIGYAFPFSHYGGLGFARINFLNASVNVGAELVNFVIIEQKQEGCFIFDGVIWNIVYKSRTTAAQAVANPVKGSGTINIGDVPAGDPTWIVFHGLNIVGDYTVYLSIKTNNGANGHRNNRIGAPTWWHSTTDKPNKFHFTLQELSNETQDISISYLIIQL